MSILIFSLIVMGLIAMVLFFHYKEAGSFNLNANGRKIRDFFSRQFQGEATAKQIGFDWTFGVVLPVICCLFDPVVFRGHAFPALLGDYKPFAYILSFIAIMSMVGFLLLGKKLIWVNAVFSGVFGLGALISLMVGLVILPFSLIGLIIIIGALGLTPLFAAFVYARNAFRAYHSAGMSLEMASVRKLGVLAALFSFCIPYVANGLINRELDNMSNGDAETIRTAGERLKYVAPIVDLDQLATGASMEEMESEKAEALSKTFEMLTGENIREARRRLMD